MTGEGREDGGQDRAPWQDLIAAHLAGDAAGTEGLAQSLEPALQQAARNNLGHDDRDADDVVSESMVAVLDYLTRRGGFQGNLLVFAVTVVRNRCRNLHLWRRRRPQTPLEPLAEWIADQDRSPLDALIDQEQNDLLQEALARLGPECEDLLRSFYIEGISMEKIRRRSGMGTVQGLYFRRARCLKKAFEHLNNRLADCSTHADAGGNNDSPEGSDAHEGS